jgi:hypothetical protein
MPKMDGRSFSEIRGGGNAAEDIGMGGAGKSGASKKGSPPATEVEDLKNPNWEDWEFYYPDKYDAEDTKVLNDLKAKLDQINKKSAINISDLINGKLDGNPGIIKKEITAEGLKTVINNYGANNPMWSDKEYAKKSKWGAMAIPFGVAVPMGLPAMTKSEGIGDYMVVTAHNDAVSYYKPVYEGEILYNVIDEQYFDDITPPRGSYYRTFAMRGWGRVFNTKGELVAEGAAILKESFRRHKDPAKRNPSKAHAWESPDWWTTRSSYQYTDQDWEEIKNIWKNEVIRGSDILYWDDVKIGDQPAPRAVGPILPEEQTDMLMSVPKWSVDTKLNVLNPEIFATMKKNKQGIYVLPQYLEKKPASRPFTGASTDAPVVSTPEITSRDGRCVILNIIPAFWAGGMIMNWMGDNGWLQRIGWAITEIHPGTSKSIDFTKDPTVIPPIPMNLRPALFDKYPYMDKVPFMKNRRADCHALEGDLVICKSYVTDKYSKDNQYFVDLTWWCETFDKYIVEEGFATVILPKKA